jgi:hypothetical protein
LARHKATNGYLLAYRKLLTQNLSRIGIPNDEVQSCDALCDNPGHSAALDKYAGEITEARIAVPDASIPFTGRSVGQRVIPAGLHS